MSNRKSVVIPKGWRMLKPHECPRRGDKWSDKWKAYYGEWRDRIENVPYRADSYGKSIIHIRRIKRPSKPASVLDGVRTWKKRATIKEDGTVGIVVDRGFTIGGTPLVLLRESDWRKIVADYRRRGRK